MLRIDDLKKSFGARVLFDHATYHFPDGERIALVGANGAGKTTLLNLLCGLDQADDGKILIPGNLSVGYLPQVPNANPEATVLAECEAGATRLTQLRRSMDEALAALDVNPDDKAIHAFEKAETAFRLEGGYSLEAQATTILEGLGFNAVDRAKNPNALSGGWRMRLELARLFIRAPNFLILDEPTNHLDLPSLVWVEDYLRAFRGTLLFVSHDRALLNRLATITLHLANARLQPYKGNFDAFLVAREERLLQAQAERDQLRRRREQMEHFVERFGAKATKAAQAQSRVKMIARIRDVEDTLAPEGSDDSVFIPIPEPAKTPRVVYQVEDGAIGYDKPLARKVALQIEKGAKIAIIGANGIGKSTLLKTMAGKLPPLGGRFEPAVGALLTYFAQEQRDTLDLQATILENLLRASTLGEKAARSLLGGFLFRGEDVFKRVGVLSGGEKSRVGLACALAQKASLLLLDEPTNHLDMASVETLAASLDDYPGTAIFVSHDRAFIDAVCTHIFAMLPDGRSMLFPGKLNDYERLADIAGFPNVLKLQEATPTRKNNPAPAPVAAAAAASNAGAAKPDGKELKRQKQKLQTRIAALEQDMQKLRAGIERLATAMAELPPQDFTKASALHAEQNAAQASLDTAEAAWLSHAEELEALNTKLQASSRD